MAESFDESPSQCSTAAVLCLRPCSGQFAKIFTHARFLATKPVERSRLQKPKLSTLPYMLCISLCSASFHFFVCLLAIAIFRPNFVECESRSTSTDSERTVSFKPSNSEVLNPERGIYRFRPLTSSTDFASVRKSGATLVYSEIDLGLFKNSPISSTRISDIDKAFALIRSAGIKTVIRIVYSHAIGESDADLAAIKKHTQQLQPILEKHSAIIFAVQAGCIGPWGEWHSSLQHQDSPDSRIRVLDELLRAIPASLTLHVRRPSFKQEFAAKTNHKEWVSRIGHHNDCLLADETDMGTYPLADVVSQKEYLSRESRTVPMGGETCRKSPEFTRCKLFLETFAKLGLTYLNADYHPEVLSEISQQGCWDDIKNQIGYRFEVRSVSLAPNSRGEMDGTIRLYNTGWAPLYSSRPVVVRMRDASGDLIELSSSSTDTRTWQAGTETSVTFKIPQNSKLRSPSSLVLLLPDASESLRGDSRYSVQIVNALRWDDRTGENLLIDDL